MITYIDHCRDDGRMPNIAGFCAFNDITRETFYKQNDYYSDTFKKIQNYLEDEAINAKNTTMGIFYLKNKFNYRDKQEIESTGETTINSKVSFDNLSTEQIRELLQQ